MTPEQTKRACDLLDKIGGPIDGIFELVYRDDEWRWLNKNTGELEFCEEPDLAAWAIVERHLQEWLWEWVRKEKKRMTRAHYQPYPEEEYIHHILVDTPDGFVQSSNSDYFDALLSICEKVQEYNEVTE